MTASPAVPTDLPAARTDLPAGIGAPRLDRILVVSTGIRAEALLNVTGTLPFFDTHFPRRPILPGVLLTESMIALALLAAGDPRLRLHVASGMRFRRFVTPGDQVHLTVEALGPTENPAESHWRATARVGKTTVAAIRTLRLMRGPLAVPSEPSAVGTRHGAEPNGHGAAASPPSAGVNVIGAEVSS